LQPADHTPDHFFIAIRKNGDGHDEVDNEVSGKQARSFLPAPGFREYLVHEIPRDNAGKHADSHVLSKASTLRNLVTHVSDHSRRRTESGAFSPTTE
jgi:hypothetical protein